MTPLTELNLPSQILPREIPCVNCGTLAFDKVGFATDPFQFTRTIPVVACQQCGLVGLNPQYPPEAYDEFYGTIYFERLGENYSACRDELAEDYRDFLLPYLREFLASIPSGGRLLDVGAGTGTWLGLVREARPDLPLTSIWALDPSQTACRDLSERFAGLNVECNTVEDHGMARESINAILCSALIEHFTDPLLALLHMNTMLATGGRLMMFTPSLDPEAFNRGPERFFKFVHTFYYSQPTLDALASKAGFTRLSADRVPGDLKRLLWFPSLVAVYEKTERHDPGQVETLRRASESDRLGREATARTLKPVASMLVRHRIKARLRSWLAPLRAR